MHMRAIYTHYTVDSMVACRKFKSQTDAGYGRGITSDDTQYVQIGLLPCRHLQPLTGSQGLARISKPFNPGCTLHTGTVLYLPSQNALPVTNSLWLHQMQFVFQFRAAGRPACASQQRS
jgi:hypothetical protein